MSLGTIKDYTPNFNLIIPEFNISGWHDYLEENFRSIDALFYNLFGINNYSGIWEKLTSYTAGQVVFIGEDTNYSGRLVKVLVNHTTTNDDFSTFFANNPTYYEFFADASTAQIYAQQAKDWAVKMDGPVEGSNYSAKYYADLVNNLSTEITTLYNIANNIQTVANISTDVENVSNNSTKITIVANNISSVNTTATNITDINTVSSISSNVTSVAGNAININSVANNNANITAVAQDLTNIDTVASNQTNINTTATNINAINTNASNITAIQNASTYATNAQNSAQSAAFSAEQAAISAAGTHFKLFQHNWFDHLLNDMAWLRADTFSWQDGTVYSDAYNHLVDDYTNGTRTLVPESNGIWCNIAPDGHRIVDASDTIQVTNVENLYNESGVAWYYILDTVNQRFKLPRENPAREELIQVVRAKGNGISVGLTDGTNSGGFAKSTYNVGVYTGLYGQNAGTVNTTGAVDHNNYTGFGVTTDAEKSGIISSMTDSTSVYKGKKYLYFYVGQFSQSATEQTAGLNSSLFNGKADIDLSNAAPNASASAKETIVGWGMPDYSTGVSRSWDTSYLADKDTVICYQTNHQSGNDNVEPKVSSDNSNWITLYGQNAGNSNFKIGGWFICPKGWYWKMTGGRNVDRALVSYIVKGEV